MNTIVFQGVSMSNFTRLIRHALYNNQDLRKVDKKVNI